MLYIERLTEYATQYMKLHTEATEQELETYLRKKCEEDNRAIPRGFRAMIKDAAANDNYTKLVRTFRNLRKSKKVSMEELSERVGVEPKMISRFETGETSISLRNFCKLAEGLGLEVKL